MSARYGRRIDDNQRSIINLFLMMGASVEPIQSSKAGVFDMMVGCFGIDQWVEVKPVTSIKARGELRAEQVEWAARWRGRKPVVVRTPDDVVAVMAALRGAMTMAEVAR